MTTIRYLVVALLFVGFSAVAQGPAKVFTIEPGPDNPRNSEGDFLPLKDGRILFAYTHFTGGGGDDATAHIAGRFSSDSGQTWTAEDAVLLANEGTQNTMSVSLVRLKNGSIALFYLRKNSDSDCRLYVRFSTDEAKSWSDPVLCMAEMGYFVVNNDRVIQLASGRLVAPAARHSEPGKEFQRRAEAMCYLSDDEGRTWRASKTIIAPPADSKTGLQEPGIVELKGGRLMMLCRTDLGSQCRACSDDGGDTWTEAKPTDILSPVSPATFECIPKTGDVLLVWNNHKGIAPELKGKRTPLTVAVSRDQGETWEHAKNIEDNPVGWYCYTAMEFVDNVVLLGYCAGDSKVGHLNRIQITRMPINWLYDK